MQKRGEPLWLPEDTELALEWQAEQRGTCKGCGHPLAETTNENATERSYLAEDVECVACRVLNRHRRALSEQEPSSTDGVHVHVTKRDGGPGSG